ncbi:hypothetical protein ACQJBY_008147 [Aegilops geniculata]
MAVLVGALPSVLTKLGKLLLGEYKLQSGLKGDVMFLQAELERMHAALENVSNVPMDELDKQVRLWASEVRELSYKIEDSLDDFMARLQRREPASTHGLRQFFGSCLDLLTRAKVRHQIATDIKDIKKGVEEAGKRRDRYSVQGRVPVPAAAATRDPRLLFRYNNVADLVGTEEAKNEIVERLTQQQHETSYVSIVGFGGLGKTTIANLVCEELKAQFDCTAFVAVSQNYDPKRIFKQLLYQFDKVEYSGINEATRDETQLIDELKDYLRNKRYFIVVDDIWNTEAWEVIRCALVENGYENRVIATTRILDVANKVGGTYKLKPLPSDASKILFHGRIFGTENGCPEYLVNLSETLLKKCGGVPLAIITIAALLANKKGDIREWHKLRDSVGTGLDDSHDMMKMRKILALSYYHLPNYLKTCLVYLNVFPEDSFIDRDQLIWRWICEGFIHGEQGENLFEVGESYFNELVNRGMIQPVGFDIYNTATGCCVHDMVLDLISSICIEENFATVLYDKKATSVMATSKVRRLSLQLQDAVMPQGTKILSHVRSLTVSEHCVVKMPPLSCFPGLRVLDLEGDLGQQRHTLKHLGSLCKLRYLGLRGAHISELPKEVGGLQLLEMLNIRGLERMPSSVGQLKNLICLHVGECCTIPPGVIGELESLQELSEIGLSRSPHTAKELRRLTKLRVLCMRLEDMPDESLKVCLLESLCKLENLQKLSISAVYNFGGHNSVEYIGEGWAPPPRNIRELDVPFGSFPYLPSWISPPNLRELSILHINVDQLRQEDLDILGRLPALRSLHLSYYSWDEGKKQWPVVRAGSFQCLRECWLLGTISEGAVMFAPGAMPEVHSLTFDCVIDDVSSLGLGNTHLENSPGLENLPSLHKLNVCLRESPDRSSSREEYDKAKAAFRCAVDRHPNRPTFELGTRFFPSWWENNAP